MKKCSLILVMFFFVVGFTMAQRTITGVIIDDLGDALIGANIVVKGTTIGTVTDIEGKYSLNVPAGNDVLVFSYTGYSTQEITLGESNVLDMTMSEGVELSQVVVTGLGIKKEKKALGYGVSTVGTEQIANRAEADVARILRGKATGVNITQTSGLAGSGTNIIIRGYSSISGNNQPLFVVDGVPFNTNTSSDRSDFTQGSSTASSRFLDLDPNSIAEISILKGLSATVLYGEAGRNGVVLVTTKNGSISPDLDKKTEVSVSQSIGFTQVANLPDYQDSFGNGFNANFGWFFSNWGPAFDVRGSNNIDAEGNIDHPYDQERYTGAFPSIAGKRYKYEPHQSVENFFGTGVIKNTSVSIKKTLSKDAAISASYGYLDDQGFTPDLTNTIATDDMLDSEGKFAYQPNGGSSNFLKKHNLGLGAQVNLQNGLKINSSFNFITSDRRTPPAASGGGSGPQFAGAASLFSDVLYTPRSIDLLNLPFQNPVDGSQIYYRRGAAITNPLWTLNNIWEEENVDRFFGTINLTYDITKNLKAQYRIGIDQYTQKNKYKVNKGGSQIPGGLLVTSDRSNNITDQVANLLYNQQINDDFSFDALLGANFRRETNDFVFGSSQNQFIYNLFTADNFTDFGANSFILKENTIGAYATATVGFRNFLYLGLQGRNDWTSTLEKENRSVFYPSVNLSFVPSDVFKFNKNIIDYLKIRVGYGTSAGYPDPYVTRDVLNSSTNAFVDRSGTIVNTNSISNRLGNPNLLAEKIKEAEFCIEANLLQNRLRVDLSLYDKQSDDLILDANLDPATGATVTTINAASVSNRGIELGLTVSPFRRGDFNWDLTVNFTKNTNLVEALAEGQNETNIAGFTNLGNFAVAPVEDDGNVSADVIKYGTKKDGKYFLPFGAIKGTAYEKDSEGNLIVNSLGEYIETNGTEIIGDPNPNFTTDFISTISWKGLALNAQLSYRDGGDIYSATTATMLARGNTIDTDFDRFLPVVLPGVIEEADGSFRKNDIQTYAGDAFFSGFFGAAEGTIFDGTNIRLREVSLSYAFPNKLLTKTPFGNLSLRIFGENLWYKSVNFPEGVNFDPEVLSLGVGNGQGFDFLTGPTAKKFGFSVNATF